MESDLAAARCHIPRRVLLAQLVQQPVNDIHSQRRGGDGLAPLHGGGVQMADGQAMEHG
jgi:hypothetical protein